MVRNTVMAGLDPALSFPGAKTDARVEPAHDGANKREREK